MYTSYAAIYDFAQQGRFGALMASWTLTWLAEQRETPKRVLDLACGTGAAALVFARQDCQVVGVDQSQAMLELAYAKARDAKLDITWIEADIRALQHAGITESSFDLVSCFADSMNYLIEDDALFKVFGHAAWSLRAGGWLVFDINTETEYETWDDRDVVAFDSGALLVYQKLSFDQRTRIGTGKIGWFVREIERWWRGEETHTQRARSDAEVRAALSDAGLTIVAAHPAPGASEERRFVYIAQK